MLRNLIIYEHDFVPKTQLNDTIKRLVKVSCHLYLFYSILTTTVHYWSISRVSTSLLLQIVREILPTSWWFEKNCVKRIDSTIHEFVRDHIHSISEASFIILGLNDLSEPINFNLIHVHIF